MLKTMIDKQDVIAAKRIQAILPILEEGISTNEKKVRRHEAAEDLGCSLRSVDRYVKDYKNEGFSGLKPKNFGRPGQKAIDSKYVKEAIALRLGNQHRSVLEMCKIIEWRHDLPKGTLKRSTMQDALMEAGFGKSQLPKVITEKDGKKAYGRFQKEHRMEMLQGDIKYSVQFPLGPNGEMMTTYFIAFVDDATRFVTSGGFYVSMKTDYVVDCFKSTVMKYGKPYSIYVDNGSQYISHQLAIVCSKLGVKIKHAPVRDGAAKGKVEAVNRLMEKFNTEIELIRDQLITIEEVNAYFIAWLETQYHDSIHSETGFTPREAFENDTAELNLINDAKVLEEAFSYQIERTVTGGMVSIGGNDYRVENPKHNTHKVRLTPTEDPYVWVVHRKNFPDCLAYTETIGPYVDKERQYKILEAFHSESEIDIEPDRTAALLEMAKAQYLEKNSPEIFESATAAHLKRATELIEQSNAPAPTINYQKINQKEDN